MSQVKKLQEGGKVTPKNLQEYNNQKAKLEEERKRKEADAEANSIIIEGKKYNKSEAKEKLLQWQRSSDARGLLSSYRNRGKNIDSDYQKFLNMIDNGEITEINPNSKGGFTISYSTTGNSFNPSDKYSSDYLTKAIENNLFGLSSINTDVESPTKINLDYNPKNMLLNTIWGNNFRQDTYNNMSERQRTTDVAKTLRENRDKFAEYFTDNSAFNLSGELPFKSMEEYDQFINDLESLDDDLYEKDSSGNYKLDTNGNKIFDKSKSTWSFAEQLRNRKFGGFWADYIFGSKKQQENPNNVTPPPTKELQDAALRAEYGLPEGTPSSLTLGDNTYIPSKEGLRDANTGELFTGYLWTEPYGKQDDYYKQGYYNKGLYVGNKNKAEALAQTDPFFRSIFYDLIENQKKKFEGFDILESKEGSGNYEFINYLRKQYPDVFAKDFKIRTEEITPYVDTEKLRANSYINLYDVDYNPEGLYQKPKYTVRINPDGTATMGIVKHENGFQVFVDDKGNKEVLKSAFSQKQYPVNHTYRELVDAYLYPQAAKGEYSFGNNPLRDKNPYSTAIGMGMRAFKSGGKVQKLQAGGNIYSGQSIKDKKVGTTKDITDGDWSNLSAADKADLIALGLDVAGLVSTAAVGVGNIVGSASGLGSSLATIYANAKRGDMSVGEQIGAGALNLAMDAATLVPGLGTWAKGAKTLKRLQKASNILRKFFVATGAVQASKALTKALSNEEMTIDDWRQLASGLTALTSTGRQLYAKNKFTQKTLGTSKPLTVSSNKDNYNVTLSQSEIGKFNGLDKNGKIQFLRDKIKADNPNMTPEELNSINLNKKELLSPRTWFGTKAKLDKSSITRELKPEVVEDLKKNRYGWFKKGLIEERAYLKPDEVNLSKYTKNKVIPTPMNSEGKVKLTSSGNIELDHNILGRVKIGKGTRKKVTYENVSAPETPKSPYTNPIVNNMDLKHTSDTSPYFNYRMVNRKYDIPNEKGTPFRNDLNNETLKPKGSTKKDNVSGSKVNPNVSEILEKARKRAQVRRNLAETEARKQRYRKGYETRKRNEAERIEQEKRNVEETSKLGAKLQRDRARQKEYQDIVNYNKQQKEAAQKATQAEALKKEERKARQATKKENKGTKKTSKDKGERIARKGFGGILRLAYGGPVTISTHPEIILPYTPDQYIEDALVQEGRRQKKQILGGMTTNSLPTINKIPSTSPNPVKINGKADTQELNINKFNPSIPLSTIASISSLISKNRTNNKIYNLLSKKLKPVILDTPQDINYNIQGNEGLRNAYYKQAANLGLLSKMNQTSDADRQLGYNFNIAKAAAEARLQGDLTNEQALTQSREKAFQVNASNLARREQVAGQNRASIIDMINKKAYLEAQKEAQNAQNKDIFLHDITEQLKQRAGEKQQNNLLDQLLTKQGNDFDKISNENMEELNIQKAMDKLMAEGKTNSSSYSSLQNRLSAIQKSRLKRNLGYQKLQNTGTLRRVW